MKSVMAILVALALVTASGCWFGGTKESPQGGIVPQDEGFSITVPASNTIKQGAGMTVAVTLNRGPYFKQDVHLDINVKPEGHHGDSDHPSGQSQREASDTPPDSGGQGSGARRVSHLRQGNAGNRGADLDHVHGDNGHSVNVARCARSAARFGGRR